MPSKQICIRTVPAGTPVSSTNDPSYGPIPHPNESVEEDKRTNKEKTKKENSGMERKKATREMYDAEYDQFCGSEMELDFWPIASHSHEMALDKVVFPTYLTSIFQLLRFA